MCKHEAHMLTGTADGIFCQGCGKVFHSFEELREAREREEKKNDKKGGKKNHDGQLENEPQGV